MDEEIRRQEEEKKEIENRLRDKIKKQEEEKKEMPGQPKGPEPTQEPSAQTSEMYNDAPTYYLPTIIPQNPLSTEN